MLDTASMIKKVKIITSINIQKAMTRLDTLRYVVDKFC